jgi:plasmid stabilization system protein ParE
VFEVIFHPGARDEAVEAASYIAEHAGVAQADAWLDELERTVHSLSEYPRRFALAREASSFSGEDLRQALVHNHRIIFTIRGSKVHVLHIRHAAHRDLDG